MSPITPARRPPARRRARGRVASRLVPLLLLGVVAFGAGAYAGARHESPARGIATRFATAWERGDYAAMHAELAPRSRRRVPLARFTSAYRDAAATATLERIEVAGRLVERANGVFEAPARAHTRLFGVLRGRLRLAVEGADDDAGIVWRRSMTFPGLRDGERLARDVSVPPRGRIEARDGTVLAEGSDRTSDDPALAAEVVGSVGPIPADQRADYERRGYPADATVGLTGLERQFERRLAGRFGGTLRAGTRTLATVQPRQGGAVRTAIDPDIERAAIEALAGRLGGIAVLRPRSGEVLALAGLAYSAPQPPGSTFKIITLAGALDAGTVKPGASFPVETFTTISGVELENANGESCGGSLANSFAHSCNSVFAPMGARLGARRLVAAAERFGFNEPSDIPGAPPASIPPADEIGDDLAVGSSAIGQGRVTATPLRLAAMTAAIANRGVLVRPTFLRGEQGRASRATTPRTARIVARFMRAVVQSGTGRAAAIPGVSVAGKTGTAELRDTVTEDTGAPDEEQPAADDHTDTDAWFVAFAPARRPRVAVAVLLVGAGAGGETAAPAAKIVLQAALD
ncbi:MAG TPA: penicillin-binding transpeptidase domain-containing protein [Solirubrobacteraceae bacterium]|nr:penicillin-binding transpeptidase domain-containing protein [Solirubrobacteraceae bacterium]